MPPGHAGGAIGGPLSDGVTAWIAAPLLFIGVPFGALLLSGTTVRELPSRCGRCSPPAAPQAPQEGYDDEAQAWEPAYDEYPFEDDTPTIPKPPVVEAGPPVECPTRRRSRSRTSPT